MSYRMQFTRLYSGVHHALSCLRPLALLPLRSTTTSLSSDAVSASSLSFLIASISVYQNMATHRITSSESLKFVSMGSCTCVELFCCSTSAIRLPRATDKSTRPRPTMYQSRSRREFPLLPCTGLDIIIGISSTIIKTSTRSSETNNRLELRLGMRDQHTRFHD
jgi:hypothetical protein